MSTGAISAVLPLKAYGRRYRDNPLRARFLLASLAAFAPPDLFAEIFVVVPTRERRQAEALRAQWPSLPLVVLCEEDVLPALRRPALASSAGWYRQQVIKLAAANLSTTEFFLTLDSDVVLAKPLRSEDIVRDGKALLQPGARDRHPRWWCGSGAVLGIAADLAAPGMAVTPAILSRTVCQRMFEHLEHRHGRAWADVLLQRSLDHWLTRRARNNWSEYSLYYLTAEHFRLLERYHYPADGHTQLHCRDSVWSKRQFSGWTPQPCFDRAGSGLFFVIQSSARIAPRAIGQQLRAYLPIEDDYTLSFDHRLRSLWEDLRTLGGLIAW